MARLTGASRGDAKWTGSPRGIRLTVRVPDAPCIVQTCPRSGGAFSSLLMPDMLRPSY
jgi:hypothetical protein